jgi:hypothetical protein
MTNNGKKKGKGGDRNYSLEETNQKIKSSLKMMNRMTIINLQINHKTTCKRSSVSLKINANVPKEKEQ